MKTKLSQAVTATVVLFSLAGCNTATTTTSAPSSRPAIPVGVAPVASSEIIMIDPVDVLPKVVQRVEPVYPQELMPNGDSGRIGLRVHVLEDGTVDQVRTSFTRYLEFMAPARSALMQWQFDPAQKDGKPTACWIEVRFVMGPP